MTRRLIHGDGCSECRLVADSRAFGHGVEGEDELPAEVRHLRSALAAELENEPGNQLRRIRVLRSALAGLHAAVERSDLVANALASSLEVDEPTRCAVRLAEQLDVARDVLEDAPLGVRGLARLPETVRTWRAIPDRGALNILDETSAVLRSRLAALWPIAEMIGTLEWARRVVLEEEWIPVAERLPSDGAQKIVWCGEDGDGGKADLMRYAGGGFWESVTDGRRVGTIRTNHVTHWKETCWDPPEGMIGTAIGVCNLCDQRVANGRCACLPCEACGPRAETISAAASAADCPACRGTGFAPAPRPVAWECPLCRGGRISLEDPDHYCPRCEGDGAIHELRATQPRR